MSTGELLAKPNKLRGSDLRWTSIPFRGSRNTPSRFMLQTTRISSGSYGPVGSKASHFTFFGLEKHIITCISYNTVSQMPWLVTANQGSCLSHFQKTSFKNHSHETGEYVSSLCILDTILDSVVRTLPGGSEVVFTGLLWIPAFELDGSPCRNKELLYFTSRTGSSIPSYSS